MTSLKIIHLAVLMTAKIMKYLRIDESEQTTLSL